jgi:predicted Fe-Mo cluster-binding NifX family protein
MKIAVSVQEGSLDAKLDMRFGRAKCFILVDPDTWEFEVVDNKQNVQASAGAGIQAAQIVAKQGADILIAGNCGPNAFRTLKAAGIKVFLGSDNSTVREAIDSCNNGELKLAEGANVDAHSGI